MKLKLSLASSGRPAVDLQATVDAAATVGDLAAYLVRSNPHTAAAVLPEPGDGITLAVVGHETLALDPRLPIAESGLHSGATVTISRSGQTFRDPQTADAVVAVLSGPDAGREFKVHRGSVVIGRENGCDVRLDDPLVSRQHARLTISDVVEVVDLGSANGVTIGSATVARATLRPGDAMQIGETVLTVRVLERAKAVTLDATSVSFIRSPRLDPRYEGIEQDAPEPPEPPTPPRFPVIALIAPIILGAVLFAITKSAASIAFVALSPLMLIGNAIESRLSGRKGFKKALERWRADVATLVEEAGAARAAEVQARNAEHPSVAECLDAARDSSALVWTRRPADPGFAEVRLGAGRQPSRSTIGIPDVKRAPRDLVAELRTEIEPFAWVDGVPLVAAFAEHGAVGIAGPRIEMLGVARGLVTQLVVLHSPSELVVTGFASSLSATDWDWLKWLPHTSSAHSPIPVRHLASTSTDSLRLVSELEDLLIRRQEAGDDLDLPAVVVLVEHDANVEHSRLVHLAENGWREGIYVVWLERHVTRLPAACRTFLELEAAEGASAVAYVHSGERIVPVAVESVVASEADALARSMAPMVDIGARVDDDSDLPRAVSLLTLTGPSLAVSPDAVIERWRESSSILTGPYAPPVVAKRSGTLRSVVGQSAGEPLALDLRADGPHALVGGTTGSGKSELLQAWILAMASAHSPQRLTFLLVDYKGGSAFRDCTELPHTIGLVTDLSPHLVRRALTSLKAELHHRELVLAQHQAKDLATLEKKGVVDAPPSLVIVVDEFAALVTEVPEFVDGVVDVAQRGRSLGLHLILATQRPAGVIKDNLRANTNLRIALRMADESDSSDVLGSPEAAFFDQAIPGRAVSKTGPGRLVPFQTGYAGGWTTDEPPPPEMLVEELKFGEGRVWEAPDDDTATAVDEDDTDIKRLTATIRAANELAHIPEPRKPWLPELEPVYDLADQSVVPSRRRDTELVFGVADDPERQSQPTVAFYPDRDGHLVVYGTGGSGKSTLLRTIAVAAGFTVRGGPCHVYGIDFGARGLAMLEALPHVGSIIDGADHERITRLLSWLRHLIDERALRYSNVNASTITEYRERAGAPEEPRILLLVDGVAAFRQAYESTDRTRWFDMFTSLATDGRPVGVHVVLSSEQRSGMSTALASAVQSRVVMRLASEDDYGMLNVPNDVLTARSPAGRAIVGASAMGDADAHADEYEVQVAVLGDSSDVGVQAVAIRGFAESMRRAGVVDAPPIQSLPTELALDDLPLSAEGPVLGISSSTLQPFAVEPRGTFIVSGPPGSGRTTTMLTLVEAVRRWDGSARLVYLGSRRSPLAALDVWSVTAFGATEIADAAAELAVEVAMTSAIGPPTVVFIEGVAELAGGLAENALQDLSRALLAEDQFLVTEGETSTLSGSFGLLGTIKSSRAGIALAPDQGDGPTVYRTPFPRTNRAEFPPGRALLVGLGRTEVVQMARPTR